MPKPSSPLLSDFQHQIERNLDWSELDQLGHANNARYFTWFEEARMSYFQKVGISVDSNVGFGPILAHTECNFLAPVTWPNTLILCAKVNHIGRSSLKMMYGVYLKPSGKIDNKTKAQSEQGSCVAFGTGVIVLVNYQTGQKVLVDEILKQAIHSYELN